MNNLKKIGVIDVSGPILITGHTGFKGTWLTLLLDKLGIEWAGISLPAQRTSLYKLIQGKKKGKEYFLDIRDYDKLKRAITDIKPRFVVHLAAQSLVLDSYKNPKLTFETNVMGTLNLLDLVAKKDYVHKIVIATTDKVYKDKGNNASFIESDPLGGKDPYSWSKIGAEAVVGAWQQLSMLHNTAKIIAVRAGNVIGGGDQSLDRLLPDLVKGFMNNSEVFIRNPKSTRPWQHVLDPLHGYLLLLNTPITGNAYNFSTNSKSLEVKRVVEIARNSWGSSPKIIFGEELSQFESRSLSVNPKKAIKELNWRSHWSQEEAIVATIQWWKSVASQDQTAFEACFQQIEELLNEL